MELHERLLDLTALFLATSTPIDWRTLIDHFPDDYEDTPSSLRKFERDKAALASEGLVLEYISRDDPFEPSGYRLDRRRSFLPNLKLDADELSVLFAAGSSALSSRRFPGREDLASALRKIAFDSGEAAAPRSAKDTDKLALLQPLWQALLDRKRVTLTYRSIDGRPDTERTVEPWGIAMRRGFWILAGWCHLRQAQRLFHLDRILALEVNAKQPTRPDFDVPADFAMADLAEQQSWEYAYEPPVEVTVALAPHLASAAARLFPRARLAPQPDGAVHATVVVRHLDGLARHLLSLGEGIRPLSPPEAVERWRDKLRRVVSLHGGAP